MGQTVEYQGSKGETVSIDALPDDTLVKILCLLRQRDRVSASITCRRWLNITLSSTMVWKSVSLDLKNDVEISTSMSQAFIPWLLQRAQHVRDIRVYLQCPGNGSNALLYGNGISKVSEKSDI